MRRRGEAAMQNSAPEIDGRADCNDGGDRGRLPVGSVVRDGEEEVDILDERACMLTEFPHSSC